MSISSEAAKIDGIESYNYGGRSMYKIPCEKCGRIIERRIYQREKNYLCPVCSGYLKPKAKPLEFSEELPQPNIEQQTQKEKQFMKAVVEIEHQVENFKEYSKAIALAKTRCEQYGSIPETMVAIELLRLGYSIIPQQKISNFKVDFCLPKQKLVIEVNGALYHQNKAKELNRELIIQHAMGFDWKIIRVPAEKIRKDIQKLGILIMTLR